jgi:hypothetical protein
MSGKILEYTWDSLRDVSGKQGKYGGSSGARSGSLSVAELTRYLLQTTSVETAIWERVTM